MDTDNDRDMDETTVHHAPTTIRWTPRRARATHFCMTANPPLARRTTCHLLGLLALLLVPQFAPAGEEIKPWAFAAFADNRALNERSPGAFEGVLAEIRDQSINPAPKLPVIDFVVACGDLKLAADNRLNWNLWLETFKTSAVPPGFYPLIGNHDNGDVEFNRTVVLPRQKNVSTNNPMQYMVDWKNVRLIVSRDLPFTEHAITSTPASIEHVFVADHYPIFPRLAHLGAPVARDVAFWNMLLKHKDRVRAFLVGHTHAYSRLRVANPEGKDAQDDGRFPDEAGGIYQVDCGNAGRSSHGDPAATLVEVLVDGPKVRFRAVQAPNATPTQFRVIDEWEIKSSTAKP